ncbi:MAG: hypothetical protein LBN39_01735 [Planctomycetaceae bacterium]|nr:hypothetical protein [Planctomycetaceae bacterium]
MPKLQSVTLSFTQEGEPLAEATVVLVPQFPCDWTIGGLTDASGSVKLRTHGKYEGAPAGQFKICVSKTVTEGELPKMDASSAVVPTIPTYEVVEPQYGNAQKTPLEIEITAGKKTFPPFDVGKAVKAKQIAPPM